MKYNQLSDQISEQLTNHEENNSNIDSEGSDGADQIIHHEMADAVNVDSESSDDDILQENKFSLNR